MIRITLDLNALLFARTLMNALLRECFHVNLFAAYVAVVCPNTADLLNNLGMLDNSGNDFYCSSTSSCGIQNFVSYNKTRAGV